MTSKIYFDNIRSDWYAGNTLLPRLIVNALTSDKAMCLVGFPAQWIPFCVHFGLSFEAARPPLSYLPWLSEQPTTEIERVCMKAKRGGATRPLVESVAALDPVIADLLYIVDHKLAARGWTSAPPTSWNTLNTWHSFGRPEVVRLQLEMAKSTLDASTILMMPCSKHRPYAQSRTHRNIRRQLAATHPQMAGAPSVVVTALGVIPQSFWEHPLVMTYNAGAVDLWRVFQLLDLFFKQHSPALVVDCLSFRPYSDMLSLLQKTRVIRRIVRPLKMPWRSFSVRLS
jgi:hypothetical protein